MNQKKLDEQLDKSVGMFSKIPEVSSELAENLVAQGFFTFDDLSVIEPDQLAELGGLTPEQCEAIVAYADTESARLEEEERRAIAEGRLRPPEPVVEVSEAASDPTAPTGNGAPKATTEEEVPSEAVGPEASGELHDEALAEEAAHAQADGNGEDPPTLEETVLDQMTEASGRIADEAADAAPEPPETDPEMDATETDASRDSGTEKSGAGKGGDSGGTEAA
jgi:N utilization substance protein A